MWKSMDTAPKDGKKIFLGYSGNASSFFEEACSWQRGKWMTWEINGFDTMGRCEINFTPNCWHPYPLDPPVGRFREYQDAEDRYSSQEKSET